MVTNEDDEMALSEHIEEFSQRLVFCLIVVIFTIIVCFTGVKEIVQILTNFEPSFFYLTSGNQLTNLSTILVDKKKNYLLLYQN